MGRPIPEIDPDALDGALVLGALGREPGPVAVERVRRAVVRYAWATGAAIGKVYESDAAGRAGFEALRALWAGGFCERAPTGIRVPEPYAYLPVLRLLLMEHVPGEPLKRLVRNGLAGGAELDLLAEALAKLHRSPPASDRKIGLEEHLRERCAALVPRLLVEFPELAAAVARILERAREAEGSASMTVAHGDLHLGQVLVAGDRLWIVDLDALHIGDPAYDLAMVCMKLPDPGQRQRLLGSYAARGGDPNAAARVAVQTALIHLKRACKRLRYQDEPGWAEQVLREVREGAKRLRA